MQGGGIIQQLLFGAPAFFPEASAANTLWASPACRERERERAFSKARDERAPREEKERPVTAAVSDSDAETQHFLFVACVLSKTTRGRRGVRGGGWERDEKASC